MSRLLNCCGRRKKTLLDLKDSMLGPFMLLALRGESSFIQVSGFVVLDRSKALISGCLKIILIRFPRPSGTVAGTGKKNSPIADRRVPSNDSRNNRITQDCSCLLVSSVMNYPYSTAKMISRTFLCYLSHLKPSSRCFYASADWPVSNKNLKTKKSSRDSLGGSVPGERESTQHSYLQSSVFTAVIYVDSRNIFCSTGRVKISQSTIHHCNNISKEKEICISSFFVINCEISKRVCFLY